MNWFDKLIPTICLVIGLLALVTFGLSLVTFVAAVHH
jgi:hypothetical protein